MKPHYGNDAVIDSHAGTIRTTIERAANDCKYIDNARRLLDLALEAIGGTCEIGEEPSIQETLGGSLVIRGMRDFTVYLSPYHFPMRDNFTIAHELGHFFLHFFLQKPKPKLPLNFPRHGANSLIERQANRFAASLLMPADEFTQKYAEYAGDQWLLSGYFGVPCLQVRSRIACLGLHLSPIS